MPRAANDYSGMVVKKFVYSQFLFLPIVKLLKSKDEKTALVCQSDH